MSPPVYVLSIWLFIILLSLRILTVRSSWSEETTANADDDADPFEIQPDLESWLEEAENSGCGQGQFLCDRDPNDPSKGKCIPSKWVCDHEYDCDDRTDENEQCPTRTCATGQFHCRLTGICIPMGYRCDREVDCGFTVGGVHDRSDEEDGHCNLTLSCPANEHKCLTIDTCVELSRFCDKVPDCPDGSDEGAFCNNAADNITCKYSSKMTPDLGPRCYCPAGKRPKGQECIDDDECSIEREGGFSPCDQLCTNFERGYNCSCVAGYQLNGKSECIGINEPPSESVSFLIANGESAMLIDTNFTKNYRAKVEGKNIQALDINHRNRTVCWVGAVGKDLRQERRVLQCAHVDKFDRNSTWFYEADYSLDGVEQMAHDWVSGNWYFIDDSYDRLFVCNSNVSICQTLLSGVLDKPKDIALDPSVGYVFVSDWSSLQPGLLRLNMDGSNMTRLVNLSIIYPYGVTLDYPKRMIYWLDSYLEYIHGIDYEGLYKRRIVASGFHMKSLYSITTFEKYLYASDFFKSQIVRIAKANGTQVKHIYYREYTKISTIRAFHRQRQPDVIHPCGENNGGCEHLCMVQYLRKPITAAMDPKTDPYANQTGVAKCACRDGYRLESSGRCVMALKYPFLLFGKTAPGTLLGVPLDPPKAGYQTMAPVRHLQRPTAVALLVAEETMYFSDAANFTIQKRKVTEQKSEVVMDEGISNCEGLAIDWMAGNLYWSDEGLLTINVARLGNSSWRKVIAEGNMSHPRAVAVHPKVGYVFWTDWADLSDITAGRWVAKIERANLNGGDRRPLVQTQVHWPNGLAIDYGDVRTDNLDKVAAQGWLYWCDAYMDRIERVRFDGTQRKLIVDSQHVAHPYGLTYFDGRLYWTEFRKGQILRIKVDEYLQASEAKKEKPTPEEMYQDASPLFEIHVFDKDGQKDTNPCSKNNGGCQHFCFFDARQKSVSCECADGFQPTKANPKLCEKDQAFETRRRCSEIQFECKRNHRCIDRKYVCDSDNDCKDFSDEDTGEGGPCQNHTCTADQFHCKSNRCIPKTWVCDGDRDCQTGEDESNCSVSDCGQNKFQCKVSKKCILSDWVCDHEPDCGPGDTSDEHENCSYPKCRNDQFECQNKQCIPVNYVCDGDRDCRDGSDEMHCDINCIQGQEFRCTPQSPCISVLYKCDGYPDCADASDEKNCERNTKNCTKNQFQCAAGNECIRSIFRCDGDADCIDGSDEAECPKLTCQPFTHFECRDGSRCIVKQWLCDGFKDCADGSDEDNCTLITPALNKCVSPNFPCKNDSTVCLTPDRVCDKKNDCADGSDEGLLCMNQMCKKDATLCSQTCHDSPYGYYCSCTENFKLQPDGRTCSAQDPCTKWDVCSQYCEPTGSHYYCYCDKDYELAVDKFTCKSVGPAKPYIIFSNRHELRLVGLRDDVSTSLAVNLRNTIAIDYFYQEETKSLVFWTDIATDKIYRGTLENFALSDVKVIVEHGIATAEGIGVDWIGHNLYWVDSSLDQIEVSKFDGRWRTTVVSGQMQNLRAIAVDPRRGLMFWTDWEESNPRIERCTLAGNDRVHNLFHVSTVQGGGWPNGLTADYVAERLYWIDAKSDSIHTITYEGKDHKQVLRGHDFLSHPFAIAIFEDKMYWTDWRVNSIVRANKWNGSDVQIIQGTSAQPFDIQIIHPSRQPRRDKNPCGPGHGGCSHLCLLNSNVTSVCKCPYLMKLMADNKTCEELNRAILFAQPMAITGVDLQAPYVNVIPVLTSALVENVSAIDIDTSSKMIYWTDIKVGAIRRSYLNGSNMQTVVDSDLPNPYGLAVDWISRNLYFTSYDMENVASLSTAKISVSTLDGEFRRVLIQRKFNDSGPSLQKPTSIVVHPTKGYMYWIDSGKQPPTIEYAFLDGNAPRQLSTSPVILTDPTSLSLDYDTNRLYWTDRSTKTVSCCDLTTTKCATLTMPRSTKPSSVAVGSNWLYFYDETTPAEAYIGAVEINQGVVGKNIVYVRNRTSRVRNLKIFDPQLQTGDNACKSDKSKRPCSQLCLALPGDKRGCACATGYQAQISDSNSCEGVKKFLVYADANRIGGLDESSPSGTDLLAPLSQVQQPTSLDFHATRDRIYWADTEANRIVSIKRDLTNRTVIIDDPVAKVHSLAVDWIADNIYWTNRMAGTDGAGVIEVARLNGAHRHIVILEPKDAPRSLHVDPKAGFLFWLNNTGIQRARLDGSERRQLVTSMNITDLALDLYSDSICWLDANRTSIACTNYDGLKYRAVLTNGIKANAHLTAFAINNYNVYWSDKNDQQGSITSSLIGSDGAKRGEIQYIRVRMQSGVSDLKVFDERAQSGTNPCAKNNGGCEHLCLYRGRHQPYVCACSFAKLNPDNKTCSQYDAFIAYSRVQRIDFAYLSEDEDPNTPYPSIDSRAHVRNVIGLAYDYENRRLFYSDIQLGSIMAAEFRSANKSHHVYEIAGNQGSVEGLAYDYIHQDLYWTSYSNASINRATVKPGAQPTPARPVKVLQLASVDKPRGIVIDPCEMQMYWTNWNEARPTIERSFLSGAMRQMVVQTDLKTPNALTIDFFARKLYWSDARLDKIERCDLDGSNRVVVSSGLPSHPFGMAVYGDYVYWTDWIMRAVVRINKYTGGDFAYVKRNFTRQPMGIIVVANDSAKCGVDACTQGHSAFCQDLCTLDERGRPKCQCRGNRVLQPDNVTCIDPEPRCDDKTMFQCSSGPCIPYEFTCDGAKECPDGDDEVPGYCAGRKCREGFIRCKNGQCISVDKKCNGVNDCGDYFDEFDCECDNTTHFQCRSGMCIAANLRCNNQANCNDASDEMGCKPRRNCSGLLINGRPMINCNFTTQCILPSWICDGHDDCWDNSDEKDCNDKVLAAAECLPNTFQCVNTKRCIPVTWRCDGDKDCTDGSDEANCKEKACSTQEFQCRDKVCILNSWTCDGTPDCTNGEDEDRTLCARGQSGVKICTGSEFACSNGRCIPQRWVCDGENDCNDSAPGTDEKNCNGTNMCPENYFQCANAQCIKSSFYCDRENDCGDNSDEPADCNYRPCDPNTQFQCKKSGRCIPISWQCNGINDCKDSSDEDEYMCQVQNGSALCKPKEYLCQNRVCIDEDLVCDTHNDCGDWSDEGSLCGVNECAHKNNPCDHVCKDAKLGYACLCHEGFKLAADKRSCIDLDECNETLPCSQICVNRPGSYQCMCASGYTLQADGKSCKHSTSLPAELIFSNRHVIWRYGSDGRSKGHVLNTNLTNAVAVDYDWVEQRVYWTDVTSLSSRIGRVFFNGSGFEVLHVHTVRNPDGLAVDWAGRNLYWCDKGVDTIEVSRLDGKFRKVLMRQKMLQEPRAVIVDPYSRYLFWSDWGEDAHIGRMEMNGSRPIYIVRKSLKWPNALTLDFITKHIFWGDAGQDYIGMSDYDGRNVRVITTEVNHIFSIGVFEEYLYWTDWETARIERAHKFTGKNRTTVVSQLEHRPMGIRVVHPLLQPKLEFFNNPCAQGGWCSNLCLLSPENGRTCACPEGFKNQGRLDCISDCKPSEFVCEKTYKCLPLWWRCDGQDDCGDGQDEMYFKPGACPAFNCSTGEFQCYDGSKCVQPNRICDGKRDCKDGSDEGEIKKLVDCATYQCISGQWKCPNSSVCINEIQRCDGRRDCPNGLDENNCLNVTCPPAYFRCSSKGQGSSMCLPSVFRCDLEIDCPDGSDEKDCTKRVCSESEFRCQDGQCISKTWVCDGTAECEDGSDEFTALCRNRTCSDREFRCKEGRCIPLSQRCDGDQDCKGGEDEQNCDNSTCDQAYFRCGNGRCIPTSWRCDLEQDCNDGADEIGCENSLNCTVNEFRCADGARCVETSLLCNGVRDCQDGSDELSAAGCSKSADCLPNQFACASRKQCIPMAWKCDGDIDCFDRSDETSECTNACNASQFQCASTKLCINSLFQCDGQVDCVDASDEQLSRCLTRPCPPGFFKCRSGKCYPSHLHCDGVRHCQDGSDESECVKRPNCDFTCNNGRCISKAFVCDGFNDCGDDTDEDKERCSPDPCGHFGACTQKCTLDKNTRNYKCYCDDGYALDPKNRHSCKAIDNFLPPILLIVGEQEIRYMDLRSKQHFDTIPMLGEKVHAMAMSMKQTKSKGKPNVDDIQFFVYWSNPHKGKLAFRKVDYSSMEISKRNSNRGRRDVSGDSPFDNTTIFPDGTQPRGVALDHVHGNLYWTDSGQRLIGVINVRSEGREYRNLTSWNLDYPYGIAVAPEAGLLFWTDVGSRQKIESSALDGSKRRLLVSKNLVYPTGLAIDQPNSRVYWADPKTSSIETISFDGSDRRLVKTFQFGSYKPMHLDVFEETIYFTTYLNHDVLMMSKFGNGTVTQVMEPLPYPATVTVWHSSREKMVTSACTNNPCAASNAICLVGVDPLVNYTCLCRSNEIYDKDYKQCVLASLPHFGTCPMACHNGGQCVVTAKRKLECQCVQGYSGPTCQEHACYGFCLNGGVCTVEEARNTAACLCSKEYSGDRCQVYKCAGRCKGGHGECYIEQQTEMPKCRCHTGWSGDNCDTKSEICTNFCYNNGTCYVTGGNKAQCHCPATHRGERCQHCYEMQCMNDGICINSKCLCKIGFTGTQCEVDHCQGRCANDGECIRDPTGLKCKCSPRFGGDNCQKDRCKDLCKNGGFCQETRSNVRCLCPSRFAGSQCEQPNSCSEYCLNGATCDVSGDEYICRCPAAFNGTRCEDTLICSSYCANGGTCALNEKGEPICDCPEGLAGEKCEAISANSCDDLRCFNGKCEFPWKDDDSNYNNPSCLCKDGWKGAVCNLPNCDEYCMNGGTCLVEKMEPACRCLRGFYGNRCEHRWTSKVGDSMSDDDIPGTVSSVVVPLVIVMLLGMLIFYLVFVRRRKTHNQFKHSRMHDVDEVQNPAFLRGGEDDDDLDALVSPGDEANTFTNPMYDSVYNDTVISGDAPMAASGAAMNANSGGQVGVDTSEERGLLGTKARLEISQSDDFD